MDTCAPAAARRARAVSSPCACFAALVTLPSPISQPASSSATRSRKRPRSAEGSGSAIRSMVASWSSLNASSIASLRDLGYSRTSLITANRPARFAGLSFGACSTIRGRRRLAQGDEHVPSKSHRVKRRAVGVAAGALDAETPASRSNRTVVVSVSFTRLAPRLHPFLPGCVQKGRWLEIISVRTFPGLSVNPD